MGGLAVLRAARMPEVDAAEEPKELALVDSSFHSSELVTQRYDDVVTETRALIFRSLEPNS